MTLRARCIAVGLLLLLPLGVQRMSAQTSEAQTSQGGSMAAQVPPLIQFANVATDEGGNTLSGSESMTFSLYAGQRGGEALWSETQRVQLDAAGRYSVQLGVTKRTGMPAALFASGETRWLGVRIAERPEQARVLLVSVPYALKAGDAATIGGLPPSAFVLAAPNAAAPGTTSLTSDSPAPNTAITGSGTTSFIPLWDSATDIVSSALFQTGSGATAKIGINTATPTATLDVKGGEVVEGLLSLPAASAATAAKGGNSQALSFTASAFNSGSSSAVNQIFRWKAEAAGNNTAAPSGTLNLLYGSGGIAPSETGLQISSKGIFTFAPGQTFPGGSGTVTSVGLSAPVADFTVTGSPVTSSGTLSLLWKKVPTSANTATAIVKRDASGAFSAGAISATQLGVSGTISTGGLTASGAITAAAMGLGTPAPSERLDLGNDGNVVIKTDPGDDATPDLVGYNLIGRGPGGVPNKWSIYTAATGGGFGVPANALSIYQYPPNAIPGCCLQRFVILPATRGTTGSTVVIDGNGKIGTGGVGTPDAGLHVVNNTSPSVDFLTDGDGVAGECGMQACNGVYAMANGDNGTGLFARSTGASSVAMLASAEGGAVLAGEFFGDVNVSGHLTQGSALLKIDHPLDPGNKYLYHSAVESPDMMNVYNGIVELDGAGSAWVTLPDYFEALNRDFRYQLTAVGAPGPNLYVAQKVAGNRFLVSGGKPGAEVSWQVTGIRQDAYANAHRIEVEQDKPERERGFYLSPELFGAPKEKSVLRARHPAPLKRSADFSSRGAERASSSAH
jgi:hypothetical protein